MSYTHMNYTIHGFAKILISISCYFACAINTIEVWVTPTGWQKTAVGIEDIVDLGF